MKLFHILSAAGMSIDACADIKDNTVDSRYLDFIYLE